jgi:carbon-monoxide dehydrogenase medium subunit
VRPIGGGTALMLMMKEQVFRPVRLVSLRRLAPLFGTVSIAPDRSMIKVGAMTNFSELEHNDDIACHLPVVVRTMRTLANVRVRNVATVGGNLAHADPHLDLPPVWIALGADVVIENPAAARIVPVEDIFEGYYETNLHHDDIIREIRVPLGASYRSSYVKITTRSAHDWPALGIAVRLEIIDGVAIHPRIVLSAATNKPTRLLRTETFLHGKPITPASLREVGEAAADEADISSDSRGSADYKKHLLRVHLGRALHALATQE